MDKFLTIETAKQLIGKTIIWQAEKGNSSFYRGTDTILSVEPTNKRPLTTKNIEGDDLSFAYIENIKLITSNNGTSYHTEDAKDDERTFTYSDDYREVEIIEIK